jgi:hypothetical protein
MLAVFDISVFESRARVVTEHSIKRQAATLHCPGSTAV